jgi:hypothetical protein
VIGRGVVAHTLTEGHKVVGIDIAPKPHPDAPKGEGFTYKSVDLTKEAEFRKAIEGCDALIHLAAVYSLQNPKDPDGPLLRYEPEEVSTEHGYVIPRSGSPRSPPLTPERAQCQLVHELERTPGRRRGRYRARLARVERQRHRTKYVSSQSP